MQRKRALATLILSAAMVLIGVALVVQTLVRGDAAVLRIVMGCLFVAAGCGRVYLQTRGT